MIHSRLVRLGLVSLIHLLVSAASAPEERPVHAAPVRPYSLSADERDYHYAPKPKHVRPARLMRLMGAAFDPFWMSVERPPGAGVWVTGDGTVLNSRHVRGINISASPELRESGARYRRKLEREAAHLDLSSLPQHALVSVREWLVRSATCGLRHRWVDAGPVFWPRWLKNTDCDRAGGAHSCSFPSGMTCQRAHVTQIKILAWHCWSREDGQKCLWRLVPYPVISACKCACA